MPYCDSTVCDISQMNQQTSVICTVHMLYNILNTVLQKKNGMLKTINIDIIEQFVVI